MSRDEIATFAQAVLNADGFDARRAAIALVVCAQGLVQNDPFERAILADAMRATAAVLDNGADRQPPMN